MTREHKIPKQRKIDGKTYDFVAPFLYKSHATRTAERRRELGWNARIIFDKPRDYYLVYVRRRKEEKRRKK